MLVSRSWTTRPFQPLLDQLIHSRVLYLFRRLLVLLFLHCTIFSPLSVTAKSGFLLYFIRFLTATTLSGSSTSLGVSFIPAYAFWLPEAAIERLSVQLNQLYWLGRYQPIKVRLLYYTCSQVKAPCVCVTYSISHKIQDSLTDTHYGKNNMVSSTREQKPQHWPP